MWAFCTTEYRFSVFKSTKFTPTRCRDGDGNPTHVQYDAKSDGKDHPTTGFPYGDTVSVKRIGANTIQATIKKGDQVVMTVTSKVSTDGKTRTSTFKDKDAQGRDVKNVVVYDKQ